MNNTLYEDLPLERRTARIIALPGVGTGSKVGEKACCYKVALPLENGIRFLDPRQIAYCEANGNYTNIVLHNGDMILISKTLKWMEFRLPSQVFYRSHGSFLVAVNSISFMGKDFVRLENGLEVSVSRRKRESLLQRLYSRINPGPQV
jgi:two-component system LytT family response regulator